MRDMATRHIRSEGIIDWGLIKESRVISDVWGVYNYVRYFLTLPLYPIPLLVDCYIILVTDGTICPVAITSMLI